MMDPIPTPEAPVLELHAVVTDAERPMLTAAARLLSDSLEMATGTPCPVKVTFGEAVRSDFLVPDGPTIPQEALDRGLVPAEAGTYPGSLYQPRPRIVVLSLLIDVLCPALRHRQD